MPALLGFPVDRLTSLCLVVDKDGHMMLMPDDYDGIRLREAVTDTLLQGWFRIVLAVDMILTRCPELTH